MQFFWPGASAGTEQLLQLHMHHCASIECWFLKGGEEAGGLRRSKRHKVARTGEPSVPAPQRRAPATGTRHRAAGAAHSKAEGYTSGAKQAAHTRGPAGEVLRR